jgi:hypothetical protein
MKTRSVVILCEDKVHETFVRRFLRCRGYDHRQIDTFDVPTRRAGSGEQFVRAHFANQLSAIRKRQDAALVVVMDADAGTVEDHRRELDLACRQAGVSPPTPQEAVVRVIPKRNIETWFRYLTGLDWDETSNTWKTKHANLARPAAEQLHEMCYGEQKLRQPAPASLESACEEWKRFR